MSKTNFSIITIVYNDISHIKKTVDSVVNQDYKQIEYILIDGYSTDGTREMITKYITSCAQITLTNIKEGLYYLEAIHNDQSTLTFKFLSERDKGIYDAMNKGIALATQKWTNFMNCGDQFYDSKILEKIAIEDVEQFDVIYGNTQIIDNNSRITLSIPSKNIKYRIPFCHQSSFVKTHILKDIPFDTSYKICADNDLFIKLYRANYKFKQLDFLISTYSLNGLSSSLSWQLFYEECKIGFKYNKLFPLYLAIKWICWTIPKKQVKKLLLS